MDPHILTHTLRAVRHIDSPEQARRREHQFLFELAAREARRRRRHVLVCRSRNMVAAFLGATRLECTVPESAR